MRRLAVAVVAAAALVFAAPFVGQLRNAIAAAFPGRFRLVVGGIVIGAIGVAVVTALVRIREHRALRYAAIAAALVAGTGYAVFASTGNPDVDAVERFHFVEYGLIALLFYRAWRHRADVAAVAGPLLATLVVGAGDEFLQWFIPARIGELHDVLLDVAAGTCGLVFSLGVDPPPRVSMHLASGTARRAATFAAASLVLCAWFVATVHLGHDVTDGATTFRSRFSADELRKAASDRAESWRVDPARAAEPMTRRLSREDQYLSEGLWHVQERNRAAGSGNAVRSWRENLILEHYFAPVLDVSRIVTGADNRWPAEQRANAEAQAGSGTQPLVSEAAPFPIYTLNPAVFWTIAIAIIAAVAGVCLAIEERPARSASLAANR